MAVTSPTFSLSNAPSTLLLPLIGLLVVLYWIGTSWRLRGIKGPFLAKYSDLWRLYKTYQADMHNVYMNLHSKYGNVVRIGPNCVSLSGMDARTALYSISGPRFPKSNFYEPFRPSVAGKTFENMFNTCDESFHAAIKKPVSRAYAMSTLLEFECFVDTTTENLLRQIDNRFARSQRDEKGLVCDLGQWLQYYAYDVIGEITFSKSFGLLDHGGDVHEMISGLRAANMSSVIGQIPAIDRWILRPLRHWTVRTATSPVVSFTMARMRERAQQVKEQLADRRDMLNRFIEAKERSPKVVDDARVVMYATSNVTAGADTTAITLRAVFYHLLKNPVTMQALEREILEARKAGALSTPCVTWKEAQTLPYLDAVIKEALRIHPAVGMILERLVPTGGVTLYDHYLPEGTQVGISPWVMGRDRSIYGEDADAWRPERWLNCDQAQLSRMTGASLAFGGGSRTCIGKNISLLEMYKLVPALLQRYEISLVNPDQEWQTANNFFVWQKGLKVRLRLRSYE